MSRKGRLLLFAPLAIVGMALFLFLGGEVVKLLWNWLLPPLFGWRTIDFWQGLALLALCRILFGGLGWRGGSMRRSMRDRMEERCGVMTPEEREEFRRRMRERIREGFGFGTPAPPQTPPQTSGH